VRSKKLRVGYISSAWPVGCNNARRDGWLGAHNGWMTEVKSSEMAGLELGMGGWT